MYDEQTAAPNSLQAVTEVKRGSDTNYCFYICHINSSLMNDEPNNMFLQNEYCFFDGAQSSWHDFIYFLGSLDIPFIHGKVSLIGTYGVMYGSAIGV